MTAGSDDWIPLIRLDQLPLDEGVCVKIEDKELAVFRLSSPEGAYVIDNACPHANGNLSAGDILPDGVVRCPWHAWKFRLSDGHSADGTPARVNSYPVEIRDGQVCVKLIPRLTFGFPED